MAPSQLLSHDESSASARTACSQQPRFCRSIADRWNSVTCCHVTTSPCACSVLDVKPPSRWLGGRGKVEFVASICDTGTKDAMTKYSSSGATGTGRTARSKRIRRIFRDSWAFSALYAHSSLSVSCAIGQRSFSYKNESGARWGVIDEDSGPRRSPERSCRAGECAALRRPSPVIKAWFDRDSG